MSNNRSEIKIFFILAILFLLPAYLIKIKYGWISFNVLELLIGILFLIWLFGKNTKYQTLNTRYQIPVFLIFFGLVLSTLSNHNYYFGFGVIKGWFALPILFAIVFYDSLEEDSKLIFQSLKAIFFSGALVSLVGFFYWISEFMTYDGRLKIFWDSPNQLAMFLAPVFLVGLFLLIREKKKENKIIYAAGLILVVLNLYFTFSYGAWLAIIISTAVFFWLIYSKYLRKSAAVFLLILLAAFLVWTAKIKVESVQNEGARSSLASREMIWKSSLLMIKNNPILGIGPGNFQEKYLEYQKYFPPYLEWSAPQPHNLLFAFWLEAGFIGLVGFIWIVILFFRDNKKAIRNNRLLGTLCLAVMLYFFTHGLFDTTYWRNDMSIIFWLIVIINFYLASLGLSSKYPN